ncbi:hypothetical protein Mal65_16080 [Crateriforma conspicua]|nr:hypothetical protein Mal65_16080 [Crateriforma conspicua]
MHANDIAFGIDYAEFGIMQSLKSVTLFGIMNSYLS